MSSDFLPYPASRVEREVEEDNKLAPYAFKSSMSKGRPKPAKEDDRRLCFQRDRDRIIHEFDEFQRLQHKAQVFPSYVNDHFRNRMTHSLMVEQVSEDICEILRLNGWLARTIALAHDLGHTPFGHEGEKVLNDIMEKYGLGYEHNQRSYEIALKHNLSYEVLEGLLKHNTPWDKPEKEEENEDVEAPLLEAQVVNLADEVAYTSHDLKDGLRAGIITLDQVRGLRLWQEAEKRVKTNKGEIEDDIELISECVSEIVGLLVNDIIDNSMAAIKSGKINSIEKVKNAKSPIIKHSDKMLDCLDETRGFLTKYLYESDAVRDHLDQVDEVMRKMFKKFFEDPSLMPAKYIKKATDDKSKALAIKDYISGMTDNFALDTARDLGII